MTYDLEIRSDEGYSQSTAFGPLQAFVAGLPHVAGAVFKDDDRQLFMNVDLEFQPPEGGPRGHGRQAGKVNLVSLHIPFAKMHDDARDDAYFALAAEIARHLGWKVFDCQEEDYLA